MFGKIKTVLISLIFLISCDNDQPAEIKAELDSNVSTSQDTITVKVHKDLRWTEVKLVGDLGSKDVSQLEKLSQKSFTNLQYHDDLLLITSYFEKSGCSDNVSNIKIQSDTLILLLQSTSKSTCTELDYYKVTYLINNSSKKHFKIIR